MRFTILATLGFAALVAASPLTTRQSDGSKDGGKDGELTDKQKKCMSDVTTREEKCVKDCNYINTVCLIECAEDAASKYAGCDTDK